jgi:acyl-coenzyme A thioesterase PaaI-like protein
MTTSALCATATLVSLLSSTHSFPSLLPRKMTPQSSQTVTNASAETPPSAPLTLPSWISQQQPLWGDRLVIPEWEQDADAYRNTNGWKGRDLVHGVDAAVRILDYHVNTNTNHPAGGGGVGTTLTGVVHFTPRAESHAGYCHGGSMCSVMDDVIGWCGFMVTGTCQPWSGFTVQVNTSLQKPVPVGAFLVVVGTITSVERRKVSVDAKLMDTSGEEVVVHAMGQGLVIVNKGVLPET